MTRVVELSDYLADVLDAMTVQGVPVEQVHPEYAPGQLELSVGATDPLEAADRLVLVKETIRAVSQAHGYRASFAPVVVAGQVGNGGHLHFSLWSGGKNLFAGGDGPYGLTVGGRVRPGRVARPPSGPLRDRRAEPRQLPAPRAPAVGRRLPVLGTREPGSRPAAGHRHARLRGHGRQRRAEVLRRQRQPLPGRRGGDGRDLRRREPGRRPAARGHVDPASLPGRRRPSRLPETLNQAITAAERDDVLRAAMGDVLFEAFMAVRRAEVARFKGVSDEDVAAATRWIY